MNKRKQWCQSKWMLTCRKMPIGPYLSHCTKLKSKHMKDLNINLDTLNLIEEKVGNSLECTGDNFLNRTPVVQTLRSRINKWDLMKMKSFCKAKDTIKRTKWQPIQWKRIFTNPTSHRGLISKIHKKKNPQETRHQNTKYSN